jgi:glyoxylase-like metal-dependent hydrolase (beta-lactamase superfamily II)
VFVKQFYVDGIAHTSYLLGGKDTCAIVDPKRDVEDYLATAKQMGMRITHILETHLHADFVSGHLDLAKITGAKIYAPKAGNCKYDHVAVGDGSSFGFEDIHVRVIDTPGHTPDCMCYIVTDKSRGAEPAAAFTGDTLFVGDVGRPDLFPGRGKELAAKLFASLHEKVMRLPDYCIVYPAHGAGSLCGRAMGAMRWSTIGYERKFNEALRHKSVEDFSASLLSGMPEAPDHFARNSDVNRRGPALVAEMPAPRPLAPKELRALVDKGCTVVDARDYGCFCGGHVPGAWNIGAAHNFSTFAGWLLPPDRPIALVAGSEADVPHLAAMLRRVGLDDAAGYLAGGMSAWTNEGMPLEHIDIMSVYDLKESCDAGEALMILDVRGKGEFDESHIEGARHIVLPDLRTKFGEVDSNKRVALMCKSGARAATAAGILQQHGFKNLAVVAGSLSAWKAAGFVDRCATCALPHGPRVRQ